MIKNRYSGTNAWGKAFIVNNNSLKNQTKHHCSVESEHWVTFGEEGEQLDCKGEKRRFSSIWMTESLLRALGALSIFHQSERCLWKVLRCSSEILHLRPLCMFERTSDLKPSQMNSGTQPANALCMPMRCRCTIVWTYCNFWCRNRHLVLLKLTSSHTPQMWRGALLS